MKTSYVLNNVLGSRVERWKEVVFVLQELGEMDM